MFQTYQRYNFESKSQQIKASLIRSMRCFRPIKDTILRANHNKLSQQEKEKKVFQTYQRYNFESKSQPPVATSNPLSRCFRPIKDTILRANHNCPSFPSNSKTVFQTYQRYNFESKSQHSFWCVVRLKWCFRPIKDTILRANHNISTL